MNIKDKSIMQNNYVVQSDLLYIRHTGSTIDQAILAYGTLRNMKKNNSCFWQPEDLYIIITKDFKGFLAINISGEWNYINFGKGKTITNNPPINALISFNEIDCFFPYKPFLLGNFRIFLLHRDHVCYVAYFRNIKKFLKT